MPNYFEILIVDDVPEQITFAGALLREEGYRVFVLTNGKAALKFLETHHPDLIMLDIKMEHIDGLEVCKRIKHNSITRDIPLIMADEVMINMLIKNIMTNAFKFTRYKEKAVIMAKYTSDRDHHIITVTDNGAGFDMAYADKLFNIFQRLHTDEEFEGTGVGLALCDRIMKRHGGLIKADGAVNVGASFSLYFLKQ